MVIERDGDLLNRAETAAWKEMEEMTGESAFDDAGEGAGLARISEAVAGHGGGVNFLSKELILI